MRFYRLLRLAFLNCIGRKRLSLHILTGMAVSAFIFITVQGYATFLREKISKTTESCRSANHVSCIVSQAQAPLLERLWQEGKISDTEIYVNPNEAEDLTGQCEMRGILPTADNAVILCGGNVYHYSGAVGSVYGISDTFGIRQYHCDHAMIAEDELQEYRQKTGSVSPLRAGRFPAQAGELLIPECYLSAYRIPEDAILGQTITVQYSGGESSVTLLSEAVVCGILKDDFTKIASREQPMLLQSARFDLTEEYSVLCAFYPADYNDLETIAEQCEAAGALRVLIPDAFPLFQYLMRQYLFTKKLLFATSYFVILSMLLNVLRIILYGFRQRQQYAAMLCSLGMSAFAITVIYLIELLLLALLALFLAVGCFFAVNRYLMPLAAQSIGVTGTLDPAHIVPLAAVTGAVLAGFCLLAAAIQGVYLYTHSSAELLTET